MKMVTFANISSTSHESATKTG